MRKYNLISGFFCNKSYFSFIKCTQYLRILNTCIYLGIYHVFSIAQNSTPKLTAQLTRLWKVLRKSDHFDSFKDNVQNFYSDRFLTNLSICLLHTLPLYLCGSLQNNRFGLAKLCQHLGLIYLLPAPPTKQRTLCVCRCPIAQNRATHHTEQSPHTYRPSTNFGFNHINTDAFFAFAIQHLFVQRYML